MVDEPVAIGSCLPAFVALRLALVSFEACPVSCQAAELTLSVKAHFVRLDRAIA